MRDVESVSRNSDIPFFLTEGRDNVVTWNDIHHKTCPTPGEHGYPDPNYLDSVTQDLAQHGIQEP